MKPTTPRVLTKKRMSYIVISFHIKTVTKRKGSRALQRTEILGVLVWCPVCVVHERQRRPGRKGSEILTSEWAGAGLRVNMEYLDGKTVQANCCVHFQSAQASLYLSGNTTQEGIAYKTQFHEHSLKRKFLLVNSILTWFILGVKIYPILMINFPRRPSLSL